MSSPVLHLAALGAYGIFPQTLDRLELSVKIMKGNVGCWKEKLTKKWNEYTKDRLVIR